MEIFATQHFGDYSMKKTQVALAAMALVASTAVLADGVTVYGTLDASVIKSKDASATFSGSGQWGANAFGLRGTSDLNGGMKIGFNLEAGVNSANGGRDNGGPNGIAVANASTATNSTDTIGGNGLFNRAANLSLITSGGTVTAGLQVTPFIAAATSNLGLAGNNFVVPYLVNAGAADGGGTGASATGGFFQPDAISYSNSAGGVSFSVLTSTGDRAAAVMNRYTGANVNYAISESTNVYAAYAQRNNAYTNWVAGIKHVAGDLTIAAQYINSTNKVNTNIINNTDTTGATTGTQTAASGSTYVLSAAYALGGGNTVGINYSNTDWSGATTTGGTLPTNSRTLTNLSFAHSMSKSTSLYAFYGRGQGSALTSYLSTGDTTMGVGINTNF
jgi:predicted porin